VLNLALFHPGIAGATMKSFRWYDHLTVNLFWLGLNIRNTALGTVLLPYLVDGFVQPEIKNSALGAMRSAGLIIAMLVQPASGLLSDRSRSRFGRRRPFIFFGVLLDLLFLAAIGLSSGYWSLFLAAALLQVSANLSHGALQGLIPDLVPETERGRSAGVKAIFELLPIILVSLTIANLAGAGRIDMAILATGAALLLIMLLTVIFVKEQPLREAVEAPLGPALLRVLGVLAGIIAGAVSGVLAGLILGGLVGLIAWPFAGSALARLLGLAFGGLTTMVVAVLGGVWAGVRGSLGRLPAGLLPFQWWIVNRLFYLAAVTSIQGIAPYFLMAAFRVEREAGITMAARLTMVVGIFTVLTALPGGWLADRFGKRALVSISGITAALGTLILLGTVLLPNLALVYLAGIIIGLAAGLFVTVNWALGTDLAPRSEAGRYLGVSNLAGAGAGMVGQGIGGLLIDSINRIVPNFGYLVIFACFAVLFLLSSATMLAIRPAPALQRG
jgi:MFS family permease